jgi:hypothetical protein
MISAALAILFVAALAVKAVVMGHALVRLVRERRRT